MVDYPEYALKLQNYLERHLMERPEWKDAVEVARSWQLEMRKETHLHRQLAELEEAARNLSAPGTAVEELQMMVGKWISEARDEPESTR